MRHLAIAIRRLWRDRAVTTIALAVLALGIGANTALFTLVDAVLLRPLPYPAAERLTALRLYHPDFQDRYPSFPVNAAHVDAWRRQCGSCEAVAAIRSTTTTLTGSGESEQLDAARVSAGFFELLGIVPAAGRLFSAAEDRHGADGVAVIGHALWQRKFGGDPSIIGRSLTFGGVPVTVIGVLPVAAPIPGPQQLGDLVGLPRTIEVFRPTAFSADELGSPGDLDYGVIARLRPGVRPDVLRAELDALEPAISKQTGGDALKRTVILPLQALVVRNARGPLLVLLSATAALLLIVCVNLANLLLARHAGRRRDAAIRTALGAGRGTLILESLVESLLLACVGGALASAVAVALTRAIAAAAPPALPLLTPPAFDARVLAFSLLTTIGAGLLFGALPAFRMAAVDPGDTLKAGSYTTTEGRRGGRTRRVLVAAQAAIGVALLVATGLLVASFFRLLHVDRGFDVDGVLAVDVALPPSNYADAGRQVRFLDAAIAGAKALPGVSMAAVTSRLPLRGESVVNLLSYPNDVRSAPARPLANYRFVSADYFSTIGTPLLRGRTFRETDRGRQVVILSARAAETLWPGQDPIGRIVRTSGYFGALSEVIGVAADSRAVDLTRNDVLFAYLPSWLRAPWTTTATLIVRTTVRPAALAASVRRTVLAIDPVVAIPRAEAMDEVVGEAVADRRFQLWLMTAFGGAAAVLAALGVYGVVTYSVSRRSREMGIRVALGATAADIRRLVFEEGLTPVAIGIAAGLAASLALGHAMSSLLFDVTPSNPVVMAAASAIVLLAAAVACAAPARRAGSAGVQTGI
ncbi:MAG TPA: ADOP family duplicated permease [Vicinamibacterales bacterium]|jgi:predicted permease